MRLFAADFRRQTWLRLTHAVLEAKQYVMQHPSRIGDWPALVHVAKRCATTSPTRLISWLQANHNHQPHITMRSQPGTSTQSLISSCSMMAKYIIVSASSTSITGLKIANMTLQAMRLYVSRFANLHSSRCTMPRGFSDTVNPNAFIGNLLL